MLNAPPQTPETEEHAGDADAQRQAETLEQKLEAMGLNEPESATEPPEPRRKRFSARDLLERLNRRRLEVTRIIFTAGGTQAGKGSHGEVVVASLALDDGGTPSESGNQVAVKKFIFGENIDEERFLRTFANELHVLDSLEHPNIIKLVGFVEDMANRNAWLIFPWEANGNVREFLLSGKWELPERVSLIKDVAHGLEYLHSRQPPIRHGDLKSLNILVNSRHRAVITDFGSARIQSEARGWETMSGSLHRQAASTHSTVVSADERPEVTVSVVNAELTLTGPSWSFRWAAPEILNEEEPCLASDIWALGWIAWEVVTDNYPFPEAKTNKLITVKVIKGLLPSLYDDSQLSQIGDLCYLMVRCWKPEPKERLSAADCRRALQWIPSTIPRTASEGIPQVRSAPLLVEMGHIYRLQNRDREALKFYEEASALARSTGEKGTLARALYLSADSYRMLRDYDKAEEACNQSLAVYTTTGDSEGRADALQRLGELHQDRSNHAEAEEYFNQALAIFTKARLSLGQANVLQGLGEIYHGRSEYAKAEEYFDRALVIYTSIGSRLGRANVLQELGTMNQARSNFTKAEEYLNETLAIYTSTGDGLGRANALQGLGEIHQARSDYSRAEECFSQALALFTGLEKSFGRANSLLNLCEVLLRQARYSEAKLLLDDAAELSTGIKYRWGQDRSEELLSEFPEALNPSTEPQL